MPPVHDLLETAIYVRDLAASAAFYRTLFGFETLLESDRLIALDVSGRSVLLLFQRHATEGDTKLPGGVIPGHGASGRTHFAFSIDKSAVDAWKQHLAACGVAVASEVSWPGGAHSVYFRDPDEHLVELLTPGFWRTY
jgi:catechol 2,3-dioxygenase-like lactoylglutathione lyase family enzyme